MSSHTRGEMIIQQRESEELKDLTDLIELIKLLDIIRGSEDWDRKRRRKEVLKSLLLNY